MKKPTSKKQLAFSTTTVRPLQAGELAQVAGGSVSVQSGTSVINPSGGITSLNTSMSGTSVISRNPSGG